MSGGYAGEISKRRQANLAASAASARGLFTRKARDGYEESLRERQKQKQFMVKGRVVGGRVLWDVYGLDGFSKPKLVGQGFGFQEEAIAFARDRILGKMAVSFGNVRGLFKPGAGGIVTADRTIELPGKRDVKVTATRGGTLVTP